MQQVTAGSHTIDASELRKDLIVWGKEHFRSFPWRYTDDAFAILIAEMMLRRTQARQVVNVYSSFIQRHPDPASLAAADPAEVASSLYSLGLAWRVPAFQKLAQAVVERHDGHVPASYDELLTLPGVGDYVASAVCCFAFGQPVIISDTNTVRVVGRLFGVTTHAESRRRRPVREMLRSLLDERNPGSYNYALLDLAALVCTPRGPACDRCPLLRHCSTGADRVCGGGDGGQA